MTNQIFTGARTATIAVAPDATVKGAEEQVPASFPFASIREMSNTTHMPTSDSGSLENHRLLMFECQNYSKEKSGKEDKVRRMALAQREYFLSIGFRCSFFQPVQSINPDRIARHVARYEALIDENKLTYQT